MPRGADGIVQALKDAGISTIFGIPSIHNIGLYESLRHEPSIRHILCRHEASATHMADGYARASGGLGVIVSSTGPGAGFTISALQEAWGSCSPVLMITSNIDSAKIGKGLGVLHELEEQTSLFRTITKDVIVPQAGDDFYAVARRAIELTLSGRPGPVCLEVPTDLMAGEVPPATTTAPDDTPAPAPLPPRLEEAVAILRKAKQPVLIAGTDAARSDLSTDLQALAEALCAPVITNTPGKGVVPEDHPLSFGNAARRLVIQDIVPGCDAALVVGSRLREVDAKRRGLMLPEQLIHVDWDERWIGRNYPTAIPLIGDICVITQELRRQLEGEPYTGPRQERTAAWRREADEEMARLSQERPEIQALNVIREVLPRESALVIDNTQLGYWAEYFYPSYQANGLIGAKGSGLLGFSFPAAIGAKVACPDTPVVGMIGDGGFLYTSQELATCVRHNIGFPLVVVNDNAFGVIGYLQRTAYQEAYQEQLTNPDFMAFAGAFGVKATRVQSPDALKSALEITLASGEMHLIEYQTTIEAPPFGKY